MNNNLTLDDYFNNLSKAIASFLNSDNVKNLLLRLNDGLKNLQLELSGINWKEVIQNYQINSQIVDNIENELEKRQIDISVMDGLTVTQAIEMYVLSINQNITFCDLVEDNLELFGSLDYDNALKYLSTLDKHKERTIEKLQLADIDLVILKKINKTGEEVQKYIKNSIIRFNAGEIKLEELEKRILLKFKNNAFIKNKDIAKDFNFSERQIENCCANIRAKFGLDFLGDKNEKRLSLILLAQYIQVK